MRKPILPNTLKSPCRIRNRIRICNLSTRNTMTSSRQQAKKITTTESETKRTRPSNPTCSKLPLLSAVPKRSRLLAATLFFLMAEMSTSQAFISCRDPSLTPCSLLSTLTAPTRPVAGFHTALKTAKVSQYKPPQLLRWSNQARAIKNIFNSHWKKTSKRHSN